MSKFIYSFSLIAFSLLLGYSLQKLSDKEIIRLSVALEDIRKILQKLALLVVVPITIVGSMWIINIQGSLTAFPLFGLGAYLLGGGLALGASRLLRLQPVQTGTLFTCGYFANVVSIGGLMCYIFLGEQGFALMNLYKLLNPINYYVIGFSIAKSYSLQATTKVSLPVRLKQLATDPFILVGFSSLALGGLFNLSGIERPAVFATINAFFIPIGTSILLISIGLTLKFSLITNYLRECVVIAMIKFVFVPVCMSFAAFIVGYGGVDDGLPLKVVMILSSMPVAFNALIATSIYSLNLDLANSCFLFTTSLLILVLPVLYYVISFV